MGWLTLTDGTTTIDLCEGVYQVLAYQPLTPERIRQYAEDTGQRHGARLTQSTYRNVENEACRILISDPAPRTHKAAVEALLLQAEEAHLSRGLVNTVYVQIDLGDGTLRSPLMWGEVHTEEEYIDHAGRTKMTLDLRWDRAYYWESTTLSTATATNGNNLGTFAGRPVLNSNDGSTVSTAAGNRTARNYVDIAAGEVDGVLPSSATLLIRTIDDVGRDAIRVKNLYIGHNVHSDPTTLVHVLEAEDATGNAASGQTNSTPSSSASSGDTYRRVLWIGASTHDTWRVYWRLTSGQLAAMGGNLFRLLLRFHATPPPDTYLRAQLIYDDNEEAFSGGDFATYAQDSRWSQMGSTREILLDNSKQLQDLGVMRLPSRPIPAPMEEVALVLTVRSEAGRTLDIDHLTLSPMDGWRHLRKRGEFYLYGTIVDDAADGYVYALQGNEAIDTFDAYGEPIRLYPGRDQRLVFVWDSHNGDMDVLDQMEATVQYRARYLTP